MCFAFAILFVQMAFQDAHTANIGNVLFNGGAEIISPFLVLRVRRESIVRDALDQVIRLGPMDYKKPLQVKAINKNNLASSTSHKMAMPLSYVFREQ